MEAAIGSEGNKVTEEQRRAGGCRGVVVVVVGGKSMHKALTLFHVYQLGLQAG